MILGNGHSVGSMHSFTVWWLHGPNDAVLVISSVFFHAAEDHLGMDCLACVPVLRCQSACVPFQLKNRNFLYTEDWQLWAIMGYDRNSLCVQHPR